MAQEKDLAVGLPAGRQVPRDDRRVVVDPRVKPEDDRGARKVLRQAPYFAEATQGHSRMTLRQAPSVAEAMAGTAG